MSSIRMILSPYTAIEINKFNKMMYDKYYLEFYSDKLELFCTVCGKKVFASESTSKSGENLHCMDCHSFVKAFEERFKIEKEEGKKNEDWSQH